MSTRPDTGHAGLVRNAIGYRLASASVALCLLLAGLLLATLIRLAWSAFALHPVELLTLKDTQPGLAVQILVEVLASDSRQLIVRGSEWQRTGENYRRVNNANIARRERPKDALALRMRDGRRVFVQESQVTIAGGNDAIDWSGMPAGLHLSRSDVVETVAVNRIGSIERLRIVVMRGWAFVTGPAHGDGDGLLPSLVGTVLLVLLMSVLVMPLGIAAAVWMHEFAAQGWALRVFRAAVNNLAAVPSVIYGVFGLALFVHGIGGSLDRWLYDADLPAPTFGGGGLLWAALTLALLTLPVVIVAVEEGLARVPLSLRQGSLALGATRSETLWKVVLPLARPALLTGMILAIARAAGEVAPLMLVGVVKLAATPALDGAFPYLHPSRAFMHLGFTIYDLALSGGDPLRAVPQAYAAALLLVALVLTLNLAAVVMRNRLRARTRRFSHG